MTKEKDMEAGKVDHTSSLIERIQQASNEISTIKNSFLKSMDELEKIQGMLSVDDISKFTGMIQDFEARVSEAERQKEEANEGARRYSQELEKEKERLMKLWDAYKNQEEELSTQEKKAAQFEERIRDFEQTKNQLEQDLTARITTLTKKLEETEKQNQMVTEYQKQMQEFDTVRGQMEHEIQTLKTEIHNKEETIACLEKEVSAMKEYESYAEYKNKYEDISREYEKEKERLTKLFRLYEDTETECNTLKKEVAQWQNWFNENEELFNKLFTSATHLKRSTSECSSTTPQTTESKTDEPLFENASEKPKKRLRFRK